MARKRYSDEDVLRLLREIELSLASGSDVATACSFKRWTGLTPKAFRDRALALDDVGRK
ncbi:MAG: hypothetical protein AAFQ64_06635 [Pseudomonadota bacterium]